MFPASLCQLHKQSLFCLSRSPIYCLKQHLSHLFSPLLPSLAYWLSRRNCRRKTNSNAHYHSLPYLSIYNNQSIISPSFILAIQLILNCAMRVIASINKTPPRPKCPVTGVDWWIDSSNWKSMEPISLLSSRWHLARTTAQKKKWLLALWIPNPFPFELVDKWVWMSNMLRQQSPSEVDLAVTAVHDEITFCDYYHVGGKNKTGFQCWLF